MTMYKLQYLKISVKIGIQNFLFLFNWSVFLELR